MPISTDYAWLLAGVILIAAEALGISGVGLLFAGLGAIAAGAGLHLGLVEPDAHVTQFCIFFLFTVVFAALLWKPMQKFRNRTPHYHNIIGETAYVGVNGLNRQSGGEVTWSGTIMKAKLAPNPAIEALEPGAKVKIVEITGATLSVIPQA
jgi:membrane protein implicated in regulation of membrane protease activity